MKIPKRWLFVLPLLITAGGMRAATKAASPFRFAVPDGWIDLSPGAPADNWKKIPSEMAAQLKGKPFAAFAVRLGKGNETPLVMSALVLDGRLVVGDDLIAHYEERFQKNRPGAPFHTKVLSKDVVHIGDVPVLRIEEEASGSGKIAKNLVYLMPGGKCWALLSFTASPAVYEKSLDLFDRTARKTQGVHDEKPFLDESELTDLKQGITLLGTLIGIVYLRRKKKTLANPDASLESSKPKNTL